MIKIAGWDVYGTLIASGRDEVRDDGPEPLRLREGIEKSLKYLDELKIFQITYSDGDLENQKRNLHEAGIDWRDYFFDLYQFLPYEPKDPQIILDRFGLAPSEFLIIGDNLKIDIEPAIKIGCCTIYVPEEGSYSVYEKINESRFFEPD